MFDANIGIQLVILFFSIVVHEYFHGYIALKCGDETAKYAGRLTFNPIPHIDIFGTIILPISLVLFNPGGILFGWAKPVPVNPYNFRNPGIDNVKVSAAGPLSNFSLAVCFAILIIFTGNLFPNLIRIFQFGIFINLFLGVLNLIPIPPLDGSHILEYFLPYNLKIEYNKIKQYGFIILLLLIFVIPQFFGILLSIVGFFESIIYFFIRMFAF